jgi:hypothetical protein
MPLLALYRKLSTPRANLYAVPLRLIVGWRVHGKRQRKACPRTGLIRCDPTRDRDAHAGPAGLDHHHGGADRGFVVLVGAFIPLARIPMAVVLLVAIFTVHVPNGFSSIKLQSFDATGAHFGQPGYETDLLYLAGLVALMLGGSGPLALDRFLPRRSDEASTRLLPHGTQSNI